MEFACGPHIIEMLLRMLLVVVPYDSIPECVDPVSAIIESQEDASREVDDGRAEEPSQGALGLVGNLTEFLVAGPNFDGILACAGAVLADMSSRYFVLEDEIESGECDRMTYRLRGREFCARMVRAAERVSPDDGTENWWTRIGVNECVDMFDRTEVRLQVKATSVEGDFEIDLLVGPDRARALSFSLHQGLTAGTLSLDGAIQAFVQLFDHGMAHALRQDFIDCVPILGDLLEQDELRQDPVPIRGALRAAVAFPGDDSGGFDLVLGNPEPIVLDSPWLQLRVDASERLAALGVRDEMVNWTLAAQVPEAELIYPVLPGKRAEQETQWPIKLLLGVFFQVDEALDEVKPATRPLHRIRLDSGQGKMAFRSFDGRDGFALQMDDIAFADGAPFELTFDQLLPPDEQGGERPEYQVLRLAAKPTGEGPWSMAYDFDGSQITPSDAYSLPQAVLSLQTRFRNLPVGPYEAFMGDIRQAFYFAPWMEVNDNVSLTTTPAADEFYARFARQSFHPSLSALPQGSDKWLQVDHRWRALDGELLIKTTADGEREFLLDAAASEPPAPLCMFEMFRNREMEPPQHLGQEWFSTGCEIPEIVSFEGTSSESGEASLTWDAARTDGCELNGYWSERLRFEDGVVRDETDPFEAQQWMPTRYTLFCKHEAPGDRLLDHSICLDRPVRFSLQMLEPVEDWIRFGDVVDVTIQVVDKSAPRPESPDEALPGVAGATVRIASLGADGFDITDERCDTSRTCTVVTDEFGMASVSFELLYAESEMMSFLAIRGLERSERPLRISLAR